MSAVTKTVGKPATRAWKNGGKSESSCGRREMVVTLVDDATVIPFDVSRCGLERCDGRLVSGLLVPPEAEDSEMADRRLFLALGVSAGPPPLVFTEGTTSSCFPSMSNHRPGKCAHTRTADVPTAAEWPLVADIKPALSCVGEARSLQAVLALTF
ncbi:hypothetical protein BJV78DRAFT_167938 [Lactifluus subvellereus]|nr:hypothetical protein BJV78DRAFT_167938 [Lactifluus subvellereus]